MEKKELTYDDVVRITLTLMSWYDRLDGIQDYFIEMKKEKIEGIDISNQTHLLFNDYTMSPMDMDISIVELQSEFYNPIVQSVASMPVENQIGRQLTLGIKENNTGTYLGFTRICSPVLSIKPRNELFETQVDGKDVNKFMVNGTHIIPVQPFGYNYLGGKLICLLGLSHEVRQLFNSKYEGKCDVIHWETTSLYGDIKGVSMYDGLKPFVRYWDMTESENLLFPPNSLYYPILQEIRGIYGNPEWNGCLIKNLNDKGLPVSSIKQREFTKLIQILKTEMKKHNTELVKVFDTFMKTRMKTMTKKRWYYSNYGYDNNIQHILDGEELVKGVNYDKFNMSYMIEWWKKKSYKRWKKLQEEGRLKTELELYTNDTINNERQIIR